MTERERNNRESLCVYVYVWGKRVCMCVVYVWEEKENEIECVNTYSDKHTWSNTYFNVKR